MRLHHFIITFIITCSAFSGQAGNISQYINQLPPGTSLSLLAKKPGSERPVIDYQTQQLMLPASTQKLLTALTALLYPGASYRFTTTLETDGHLSQSVLQGNLIARFSGDPTLKREDLHRMVAQLKTSGIRKIQGNLIIDTSVFTSHDKAPGWSWNDMTQCFSAPPSAAIIDHNCFTITLNNTGKPGDIATVKVASYYPVSVQSQVRTMAENDHDARYCEFDVVTSGVNHYTLTGCLARRHEPLSLTFAVQDGTAYAGAILKAELASAGISFSGKVLQRTQAVPASTVLARNSSASLHNLLQIMLKHSDNMIADAIFRTIGQQYFGAPGTWRTGANAMRQILLKKADIDLANSVIVDGSGLSRHNLMSARIMMQALQYIAQHDDQLNFISMLPISGVDGTLQHRRSLHEAGLDGKIQAKTGALQGVYNLAGFITTANGERLAFVQYLSGYSVTPGQKQNRRAALTDFEKALYQQIYQNGNNGD